MPTPPPDFASKLRQPTWAEAAIVVVDLSDTEFFDEAGIEAIIAGAGQAAGSGCRFSIVCTWWPILRMLQAARLDKTLPAPAPLQRLEPRQRLGSGDQAVLRAGPGVRVDACPYWIGPRGTGSGVQCERFLPVVVPSGWVTGSPAGVR